MFSDTTSVCVGFCQVPTISSADPLLASPDHLSYFRDRMLCELGLVRKEWAPVNICSQRGNHNRAPGGSTVATVLPQGHSGKSGTRKQAGLFTETLSLGWTLGPWGLSQVRCTQIQSNLFVPDVSVSLTCRALSSYQGLICSHWPL